MYSFFVLKYFLAVHVQICIYQDEHVFKKRINCLFQIIVCYFTSHYEDLPSNSIREKIKIQIWKQNIVTKCKFPYML